MKVIGKCMHWLAAYPHSVFVGISDVTVEYVDKQLQESKIHMFYKFCSTKLFCQSNNNMSFCTGCQG